MICQNKKLKIVLETKDHKLYKCLSCNLIFAQKNNEIEKSSKEIYNTYYQKNNASRFSLIFEWIIKVFRFMRAYKIYLLKPKAKSVLDVGSGRGWMIYFLKKYFKYNRVVGTQISENAYKFSKEKLGLEIYNEDLLTLSFPEKFDMITIWHVLEHVEYPEKYIEKIYTLLNDKGLLFLEVPNFNSWTRILTKEYWLALDLKHHLTFFTSSSIVTLLRKYDFKIKKIRTFSLEYSVFTSTQSLISLITKTDSYFFEMLQKRNFNIKMIWHTFLFIILFLPCLLINLFLYFSKYGEVLTIIAEKNGNSK